jgi:hypothetical protein
VNLLGDNIDNIKKNTETLTDVSKEVGLEANAEQTKHMLLSRHQKVGQNHDINTGNRFFENVAQFKYLGTTETKQNSIQVEIKNMNSGNACYHSVRTSQETHHVSATEPNRLMLFRDEARTHKRKLWSIAAVATTSAVR